jgi:ankyrin repeat protein
LACYNKLSDVALELIKTNQSKPDQINSNGNTALIWACNNKLSDVALELIKTNQSKPDNIDSNGNTILPQKVAKCHY